MKRRLFYLIASVVIVLVSIVGAVYHPVPVIAASNPAADAEAYCNSIGDGPTTSRSGACLTGYSGELRYAAHQGPGESQVCNFADSSDCEAGWNGAKNNIQPGSTGSVLQGEIAALCSEVTSSSAYKACAQGVTGESQGKTKTNSCQGAADQTACNAGWTAEQTRQQPSQVSQAAQTACKQYKSDANVYTACLVGNESGSAGDQTNAACNNFQGSALSACQQSWTSASSTFNAAAGVQQNTDNSPTCEASGFSLSWILCPIFDLVSDASHWIFQSIVQPFLVTQPITTNTQDPTYQIWSNFRIYGDIFLILALFVVIFGESIGGGLIDAYTAKKVLPRLLAAAILINLSIYIVGFLVDVTNIVGKGIGSLITAPLTNCHAGAGNCWDFHLSNTDIASVFGVGFIGFLATSTAVAGLFSVFFGGVLAATTAITAAFFVALPMIFAIVAVFLTLILRKGLILLLVLVSPVAFALYTLPNTERYFKRWWDLLLEALLIYPIVVAIFGAADVLSITLLKANSIAPSSFSGHVSFDIGRTLALVSAFLLQFLPLLAIPFAFRFASGALGRIYTAATSAGGVAHQALTGRREQAKKDYGAQSNAARARLYNASFGLANKFADDPNANKASRAGRFVARRGSRWLGKKAGGYNIEAVQSAARTEAMKQFNDQIAAGVDTENRGLSVDKKSALRGRGYGWNGESQSWRVIGADGKATGATVAEQDLDNAELYDYKIGKDGKRDFMSLGGAWIDEASVDRAHSRWGRNQYMQQAALSYEMRKGSRGDQRKRIRSKYMELAKSPSGWGMSSGDAGGVWKGSSFEHQNTNLEYKYFNPETGVFDHKGFVSEVFEKRGSYDMSRMDADTIGRLSEAWRDRSTISPEAEGQLKEIAKTMQDRIRSQGLAEPVKEGAEPGEAGGLQAASLGAGHVSQAMTSFVEAALKPSNGNDGDGS